jgi:hypothetical protein
MITKGPWNISKHATPEWSPQFGIYSEANPSSRDHVIVTGENADADSQVIAAVPELIEACKGLLWHRDNGDLHIADFMRIRAVLEKAGIEK